MGPGLFKLNILHFNSLLRIISGSEVSSKDAARSGPRKAVRSKFLDCGIEHARDHYTFSALVGFFCRYIDCSRPLGRPLFLADGDDDMLLWRLEHVQKCPIKVSNNQSWE